MFICSRMQMRYPLFGTTPRRVSHKTHLNCNSPRGDPPFLLGHANKSFKLILSDVAKPSVLLYNIYSNR